MKVTPLPFQPHMAAANWDGLKTHSRRDVKKLLRFGKITEFGPSDTPGYDWHFRDKRMLWNDLRHAELLKYCPYGRVGDLLWAREAWSPIPNTGSHDSDSSWAYRGGGYIKPPAAWAHEELLARVEKWRPAMFMPRWASRMTLELTEVRVERVQEISEEDAAAEGMPDPYLGDGDPPYEESVIMVSRFLQYRNLWNEINGPDSWAKNPWVWVLVYEVHRMNVDALLREREAA